MTTIKDIFSEFAPEYIERYGETMPNEHRKVIQAIIDCRSGELGSPSITASVAGSTISSIDPAAIVIVPTASTTKPKSGS